MATNIVDQLKKEIADRKAELKNLESALATLSGSRASKGRPAGKGGKPWTPERRAKMEAVFAARAAKGSKKKAAKTT